MLFLYRESNQLVGLVLNAFNQLAYWVKISKRKRLLIDYLFIASMMYLLGDVVFDVSRRGDKCNPAQQKTVHEFTNAERVGTHDSCHCQS